MRYDEIFTKPIKEYTDDEIRERAVEMRGKAKLTKKRSKKTSPELTATPAKKDKGNAMLEEMMNNAKLTAERNEKNA